MSSKHPFREAVEERDEVSGKKITGCDFLHFNDDGLIDDFMVMVRPLSGATALSEAMGAQFDRIQQDAAELAYRSAPTNRFR